MAFFCYVFRYQSLVIKYFYKEAMPDVYPIIPYHLALTHWMGNVLMRSSASGFLEKLNQRRG